MGLYNRMHAKISSKDSPILYQKSVKDGASVAYYIAVLNGLMDWSNWAYGERFRVKGMSHESVEFYIYDYSLRFMIQNDDPLNEAVKKALIITANGFPSRGYPDLTPPQIEEMCRDVFGEEPKPETSNDKKTNPTHITLEFPVYTCRLCGAPIMNRIDSHHFETGSLSFLGQLEAQGVKTAASRWDNNLYHPDLCCDCETRTHEFFTCALCGAEREIALEEESFGDPPESACSECYNTMTAREWSHQLDILREKHRYDYE